MGTVNGKILWENKDPDEDNEEDYKQEQFSTKH